ncbi:EAL domain-containing protein [Kiloniella sp.]|uniref:EAL domain-containing response regulator n=1 Tax=Kiloniella sp. TaxID=1938587 RepID=UPI003B015A62
MRVLVLDDDKVDFLYTERLLSTAFSKDDVVVSWVSDPTNTEILDEIDDYNVCFVDQYMGPYRGIELIQKFTEVGCLTPMILLTREDNQALDEMACQSGASDYLLKDELTPALLNRSVRFSIAQKTQEKKLTKSAFTDGLTGLANRTKFDPALEMALLTTERANTFLALFLIDLDDFKNINDIYGHPAGDKLLKEISSRLKGSVRKSDIVARLGGDEFGVVLNGYRSEADILTLKEKITKVFDKPIKFGAHTFQCKGSVGIAVMPPEEENRSANELIRAADGALYKAKESGKNSVEFFDPSIGEHIEKVAGIEHGLALAIERNEFELHYQPRINVGSNLICGAEVLLRWHRENQDPVSPSVFIPIAERSKKILEIGRWVVEEACRQQRAWIDAGTEVLPLSINVSPLQVKSDYFVPHIKEMFIKYRLDPSLFEFEIAETALMENLTYFRERLEALADIGCTWAIDDFGVGHSSLSRISDLPISKIKMDRSFVRHIESSSSSRKICNVMTLLANVLGLGLVIKGVERNSQVEMLSLFPKDELQGFLYSKAQDPTSFENSLIQQAHESYLANPQQWLGMIRRHYG